MDYTKNDEHYQYALEERKFPVSNDSLSDTNEIMATSKEAWVYLVNMLGKSTITIHIIF